MARLAINDPLEKFRFLITLDIGNSAGGQTLSFTRLGFHDVQMPKRSTTKILYREGADKDISQVSAGLSTMEDLVMSRGVVAGDDSDFYRWIARVHNPSSGSSSGALGAKTSSDIDGRHAMDYRADMTIKMLDRNGAVVRQWKIYQAWPMHYVPGSDLNAGEDGEKSIESLTLAYEDFQEIGATSNTVSVVP